MALKATRNVDADDRVIFSERDIGMSPVAVQVWFHRHYHALGFVGASSHSGRRWFMTELAKGGVHPRIIQQRAGHTSLATTQRYIEITPDQERRALRVLKF